MPFFEISRNFFSGFSFFPPSALSSVFFALEFSNDTNSSRCETPQQASISARNPRPWWEWEEGVWVPPDLASGMLLSQLWVGGWQPSSSFIKRILSLTPSFFGGCV